MKRTFSWNLRYLPSWTVRVLCRLPRRRDALTTHQGCRTWQLLQHGWRLGHHPLLRLHGRLPGRRQRRGRRLPPSRLSYQLSTGKNFNIKYGYGTVFFYAFPYHINVSYRVNFINKKKLTLYRVTVTVTVPLPYRYRTVTVFLKKINTVSFQIL